MELSWTVRLRIAAAACVGAVLIGIVGWRLAAPSEPLGPVYLGMISIPGAILLAGLAFLVGLIGYFISWPYGREIGVLAVPVGLAVWGIRSGSMAELMLVNGSLAQREAIFSVLRWESLYWLGITGVGIAGVLAGQRMVSEDKITEERSGGKPKPNMYLNVAIALLGSVLVAQFCIRIFVQDVNSLGGEWGSVVGQPAVGQIAFGVMVSFGIAGFVAKKFLGVSYIWSATASFLVTAFSVSSYAKPEVLERMCGAWPSNYFANSVVSILPLQMVAFGVLGSIGGYWLAVRYRYWREY